MRKTWRDTRSFSSSVKLPFVIKLSVTGCEIDVQVNQDETWDLKEPLCTTGDEITRARNKVDCPNLDFFDQIGSIAGRSTTMRLADVFCNHPGI